MKDELDFVAKINDDRKIDSIDNLKKQRPKKHTLQRIMCTRQSKKWRDFEKDVKITRMTQKHDTDRCVPFRCVDDVSIFGVKEENKWQREKSTC